MRYRFLATKRTIFLTTAVMGGFILFAIKTDSLPYMGTKVTKLSEKPVTSGVKANVKLSVLPMTQFNSTSLAGIQAHKSKLPKDSDAGKTVIQKSKSKIVIRPDENLAYFKRRKERVTPLDFNFIITSDVCDKGPTDLLIMVISMASHTAYRDAIRETWGGVNYNNTWAGTTLSQGVRLVFLFGITANESETESLKKEAAEYRDIVLADFKENYFNLTYKVLMGFKWITQYCTGAKYVMKNDEDSVVHIPWLLERLKSPEWNTKIIGPYFTDQVRFTGGKFGVRQENYPFHFYPPHVKGNIYVMSTKIAFQILEVSEYMPYVNMEDVHITGILAKVIGVSHKGISRSEYNPSRRPGVCDVAKRRRFAGRDVSASYARDIWKKILNPKSC